MGDNLTTDLKNYLEAGGFSVGCGAAATTNAYINSGILEMPYSDVPWKAISQDSDKEFKLDEELEYEVIREVVHEEINKLQAAGETIAAPRIEKYHIKHK